MEIYRDQYGDIQMPHGYSRLPKVEREELVKKYINATMENFEVKVMDFIIKDTIVRQQALDVNQFDPRWKTTKSGLLRWEDQTETYIKRKPIGFTTDFLDVED